jgi:shikimate kinase
LSRPERLVLVGFMGAGKSTVGALLARLVSWDFRDMDALIEERTGLTVSELFRERGEAEFRQEETRLAWELASARHVVVAAGGGAFAVPETREALRSHAATVWLRADLPTLLARLDEGAIRPLASDRETMQRLLAHREAAYRLADWTVETSGISAEEVARRILQAVLPDAGPGAKER